MMCGVMPQLRLTLQVARNWIYLEIGKVASIQIHDYLTEATKPIQPDFQANTLDMLFVLLLEFAHANLADW